MNIASTGSEEHGETIRLNPLSYQILGVIARSPSSGYDVMKTLHRLRPVKISQIYKALSTMEAVHLVASQEVIQHGKPNKRVFELTNAGCETLNAWIASPTTPPVLNDSFVSKTFSLWHAPQADRLRLVAERIGWLKAEIAYFQEMQADLHETAAERHLDPDRWEFSRDILVRRHLALHREDLLWCQRLHKTLSRHKPTQSTTTLNEEPS
ncbi:PadR family transcriptional regulator [Pararhodobacter sp.]|uniref:PadR family transcriptional regulator n=1 Tax=Pararhodobacter sp. TaxID=2127056 RepID=UPI002AFF94F9|nr:PadR family transcriptional regulator [Pararhodobacter sp.]